MIVMLFKSRLPRRVLHTYTMLMSQHVLDLVEPWQPSYGQFFCIRAVTPKLKKCGVPIFFSQLQKGIGIAVVSLRILQCHTVLELKDIIEDFPGGPVLKTASSAGGYGSIPDLGTNIPMCLMAWPKKRERYHRDHQPLFQITMKKVRLYQKSHLGISLVVQRLRVCLPMQGTWVRSLL